MSYLTDYCITIRAWLDDISAYSDDVVTQWVRDGEERMNNELRSVEQIVRENATFDDNCAALPPDWLEFIYVRQVGGDVYHYATPDAYWQQDASPSAPLMVVEAGGKTHVGSAQMYTVIGQTLFVLPPIDPEALTKVEICYFRKIMPLGDTKDPVLDRYPSVYRNCTLQAAAPYLIEDERLNTWASLATAGIAKANEAARAGRWSGSPLLPRSKGFG